MCHAYFLYLPSYTRLWLWYYSLHEGWEFIALARTWYAPMCLIRYVCIFVSWCSSHISLLVLLFQKFYHFLAFICVITVGAMDNTGFWSVSIERLKGFDDILRWGYVIVQIRYLDPLELRHCNLDNPDANVVLYPLVSLMRFCSITLWFCILLWFSITSSTRIPLSIISNN